MMQAMAIPPRFRARKLAILALVLAVGTVVAFGVLLQVWLIPLRPVVYLSALAVAVGIAVISVALWRGWLQVSALVVSALLLVLAAVFNFVLMRVPTGPSAFVVGAPAPDFTLPDATGAPVRLADFRGKKPVVLVFYRGYW